MAKLSDDVIKQIQDLYKELGVYAQVAKKLGVSASSVKKYVVLGQEEDNIQNMEKTEFKGEIKDIKDIPQPKNAEEWREILKLTSDEWKECDELRKEGVI